MTLFAPEKMRPSQGFWITWQQGHLFQGNKGIKIKNRGNRGGVHEGPTRCSDNISREIQNTLVDSCQTIYM